MAPKEPPLDEIQWSAPHLAAQMQGIHDNSVLHYFAESPFFDRTSNNAVITNQAHFHADMFPIIQTREAMERHMQGMAGLEFVVAERPREFGPGAVWVINKQLRKKRFAFEDEISVLATYFIVGINIYKAPTLADIISSRIATICNSLGKVNPEAEEVQSWTASNGSVYRMPANTEKVARPGLSKESTPAPDSLSKPGGESQKVPDLENELERLAEESFSIHLKYGGDFIDENPITGRPGEFHLSSTGRKDKVAASTQPPKNPATTAVTSSKPDEPPKKGSKTPETAAAPKPKRRKSKINTGVAAAS